MPQDNLNVQLTPPKVDMAGLVISFTATLVGALTFAYVQKKLMSPDTTRELYMRLFRTGRVMCQSQADFWSANAARCATAYQKMTL